MTIERRYEMFQETAETFGKAQLAPHFRGAVAVDYRGAVASVRDSYTDDPSSIPVLLVVASWF